MLELNNQPQSHRASGWPACSMYGLFLRGTGVAKLRVSPAWNAKFKRPQFSGANTTKSSMECQSLRRRRQIPKRFTSDSILGWAHYLRRTKTFLRVPVWEFTGHRWHPQTSKIHLRPCLKPRNRLIIFWVRAPPSWGGDVIRSQSEWAEEAWYRPPARSSASGLEKNKHRSSNEHLRVNCPKRQNLKFPSC